MRGLHSIEPDMVVPVLMRGVYSECQNEIHAGITWEQRFGDHSRCLREMREVQDGTYGTAFYCECEVCATAYGARNHVYYMIEGERFPTEETQLYWCANCIQGTHPPFIMNIIPHKHDNFNHWGECQINECGEYVRTMDNNGRHNYVDGICTVYRCENTEEGA